MRPVNWRELVAICEAEKCVFDRQKGDHYIMTRPGLSRPIVIPIKKDLKEDIVLSIARTLGLKRKDIEERLNPKKGRPLPTD